MHDITLHSFFLQLFLNSRNYYFLSLVHCCLQTFPTKINQSGLHFLSIQLLLLDYIMPVPSNSSRIHHTMQKKTPTAKSYATVRVASSISTVLLISTILLFWHQSRRNYFLRVARLKATVKSLQYLTSMCKVNVSKTIFKASS